MDGMEDEIDCSLNFLETKKLVGLRPLICCYLL